MRRFLAPLAFLALVASGTSCTTDPLGEPIISVLDVSLTGAPADSVMLEGTSRNLIGAVLGPRDSVLGDRDVEWSTSDLEIATVNDTGRVTAVDPGDATITFASEGFSASTVISVREYTTVPNGGTRTATLVNGRLRLVIPNSVAPTNTVIHARAALTWPPNTRIVEGSVMEIGPIGTELASNITVGITFVPANIPADQRSLLRLHALQANGTWAELPNASVDLNNSRVNAGMSRLSKVAIFRAP